MSTKRHGLCRFTIEQEKEICRLYINYKLTSKLLAQKFDCSPPTINNVLRTHEIPRRSGDKNGRIKTNFGYILIYKPTHPHANTKGYVLEHRLNMELCLGRYLKADEIVHHKNKIRDDNRGENLELVTRKSHILAESGEVKCPFCKEVFRIK